jgi:ABC-2 type transport system ATP-binding protein
MNSIHLENLSVEFPIYHLNARSLKKRFLQSLMTGGKVSAAQDNILNVRAIDNISLRIEHGDRVGLIGPNGAGKSTLLRVLSGIYEPTHGLLNIEGRVSPLLDIAVGINAEATGYENIMIQGAVLGLTRKEIQTNLPRIVEFTGLGDYLLLPIHTYSNGMRLRLAFSVATSIAPEILVMDEIINVGDTAFLKKARLRMDKLIEQSGIVVLASHATEILTSICNKVLFMKAGKVEYFGPVQEGIELYESTS